MGVDKKDVLQILPAPGESNHFKIARPYRFLKPVKSSEKEGVPDRWCLGLATLNDNILLIKKGIFFIGPAAVLLLNIVASHSCTAYLKSSLQML